MNRRLFFQKIGFPIATTALLNLHPTARASNKARYSPEHTPFLQNKPNFLFELRLAQNGNDVFDRAIELARISRA